MKWEEIYSHLCDATRSVTIRCRLFFQSQFLFFFLSANTWAYLTISRHSLFAGSVCKNSVSIWQFQLPQLLQPSFTNEQPWLSGHYLQPNQARMELEQIQFSSDRKQEENRK